MIGHTNYLLELSPERTRQTYLSFYATGRVAGLPMVGVVLVGKKGRARRSASPCRCSRC